MPRSVLHDHADLILGMVEDGATNEQIRYALLAKSVTTSTEAVRVWVNKHAPSWMLENRGPGRRRNQKPFRFNFLPNTNAAVTVPPLLQTIIELLSASADQQCRAKSVLAEAILRTAGIKVDITVPPSQWTLTPKMLADISDLELVLLVYVLSERHGVPHGHGNLRSWLIELVRDAAAMKAKIADGADFSAAEFAVS